MTDLLDRQAVLYYVKSHIQEIITESGADKNAHTNQVLRAIMNGIETMPPVQPKVVPMAEIRFDDDKLHEIVDEAIKNIEIKPKWIPVSERLPEDRREVLVTAYWHETYQVMMASYFGDGLWWCVPFNNCGEHMQRIKPKAWMPLPEPYKEGEK